MFRIDEGVALGWYHFNVCGEWSEHLYPNLKDAMLAAFDVYWELKHPTKASQGSASY